MMVRSWYGNATLTTRSGCTSRSSATSSGTLSASTCAVLTGRSICAAIFLHFSSLRLASTISEKTSGTWAHLWVTTPPTPPAPMIRTFDTANLRQAALRRVDRAAAR